MPPQEDSSINSEDFLRLRDEFTEMKQLMGQMTQALTRLALLEERQQGVSVVTGKILEQVEQIRAKQHETDLRFATQNDFQSRIKALEDSTLESHIEYARDKAALLSSFRTVKFMLIGSWAVFLFVAGLAAKLLWGV